MVDTKSHADDKKNASPAFEQSDVNLRSIIKFFVWMTVAAFFIHGTMWVLMRYFLTVPELNPQQPPASLLVTQGERLPQKPRLQPNPADDLNPVEEMKRFRASEAEAVKSYGWVDRKAGVVKIPIDRAIDLMAQKGLPSRQPSETQGITDQGQEMPEYSSAGRTYEKRLR